MPLSSLRILPLWLSLVIVGCFMAAATGIDTASALAASIDCAAVAAPASGGRGATPAAEPTGQVAFPSDGGALTVFAAASLTDSFNEIKATLEAANPDLSITYNFAGSSALVTQLAEGAKADVFASASSAQMTKAQEADIISGDPVVFTQNRLAIVVPKDNPAGLQTPADLAKEGVKLVLAQPEVPVGQYARQSICKAGADRATFGDGFVDKVAANIVSEEDNVKSVLAKVRLGEADAGIVYTTDITAEVEGEVSVIEIPESINVVATYPIAPVTGGNAELAAAFISYVLGPDGQAVLQKHGFEPSPFSAR
jgi:molybdate transport system substrate-binding protein